MWYGLAGRYTDEASLIDPARGWAPVVDRHLADVVQTDNVDEFKRWLRGEDVTKPDPLKSRARPGRGLLDRGQGRRLPRPARTPTRAAPQRTAEGIDLCDQQGALVACWVRQGEWMKYDVDITREGTYRVWGRLSTKYSPAGKLTRRVPGHRHQRAGRRAQHDVARRLRDAGADAVGRAARAGTHTYYVRIDPTAYQNFNIDYVQFDRLSADRPRTWCRAASAASWPARCR